MRDSDKSSHRVLSVLVLLFLVTAVVYVGAYASMANIVRIGEFVDRTYQYRTKWLNILTLLMDAEIGARGYALTEKRTFLEPYERAINELPAKIEEIKTLNAPTLESEQSVRTLETKMAYELAALKKLIELKRNHAEADEIDHALDKQKDIMDAIRPLVGDIDGEVLTAVQFDLHKSQINVFAAHALFPFLGCILLVLFLLILLQLKRELKIQSELSQSHERLIERDQLLQLVLNNISDAIFYVDTDYHLILKNKAFEALLGKSLKQNIGPAEWSKTFGCFLPDKETFLPVEMYPQVIAMKGIFVHAADIYVCNKENPEGVFLSVNASPVRDSQQNILGAVCIARNINYRIRIEEDLKRARDAAVQAFMLKSQFVANISHEIRTPLAGILGMSELLCMKDLDEETKDLSANVLACSQHLLKLVNDLLDFSKLEAGKIDLESIPFSPSNLVKDVVRIVDPEASRKKLDIKIKIASELPDQVVGDPTRVRQILMNLVHNAVKFTESGQVEIIVDYNKDLERRDYIKFTVIDTGIGVPEKALDYLFQPFVQADGSTTRRYGGTGLGLSISKSLANLMGGEIGVENRQDGGSIFWFTVPTTPSLQAASAGRGAS